MSSKVTIREDRMLEFNEQPFFALQARHLPVGATIEDVADAGFNCFRTSVFGTQSWGPQTLPGDLHGLKICAYLYDRTNLRVNPDHRDELITLPNIPD